MFNSGQLAAKSRCMGERQPTRKVEPTIPAAAYARLEYLVKVGLHGSTPTDVARTLILNALQDLWRENKLPDA